MGRNNSRSVKLQLAALAGGIAAPLPEPASLALLAIGALGVMTLRKRRKTDNN
jgi:hypothetical protein